MWGQEKKEVEEVGEVTESTGAASEKLPDGKEDISAFVGKGVEFKGTISYKGTVRIDGYLDGEIHTDGVLLVGEEAVIQAKITAGIIVCKGKITGDVVAKERVKLRAPAVINGSVKAPMLSMEDGVLFNGGLEMTQGIREGARESAVHQIGVVGTSTVKRINV